MQVQLLKKMGSQLFIGQCVHSNAILRFEVSRLPSRIEVNDEFAVEGCQFVAATNTIKCEVLGANGSDHGQHGERRENKRSRLDIGARV